MDSFFNAVEQSSFNEVEGLLKNGYNINSTDEYGYSALHLASSKGLVKMAIFLIDKGIDVNTSDKNGQTILHYAALNNQLDVAKAALEKNANLSIDDIYGNQPLWTAVFNDKGRNDRFEMVKLFVEYGADVNHKNKVGKSPKEIIAIAGYNNLKVLIS